MGVTGSVQEMIDELVSRYQLADAGSRALLLGKLQRAEEFVWGYRPWWFKQMPRNVALVAGEARYTVEGATDLVQVRLLSGKPLEYFEEASFRRTFKTVVTGTPQVWTVAAGIEAGDVSAFEVWPYPEEGMGPLEVVIEAGPVTLSDSASSVSGVPAAWRHVVLEAAEDLLASRDQELQTSEQRWTRALAALALLKDEDEKHKKLKRR